VTTISIIIPAHNEERTIARCIRSALEALARIDTGEIIVVDAASQDNTAQIATGFPVRVVRLGPDVPFSPGAARYVGTRFAAGRFLQILDADMTVDADWLPAAMEALQGLGPCAGVCGVTIESYPGDRNGSGHDRNRLGRLPRLVSSIPGAGMFRAVPLLEAGSFNPFLEAEEEANLCFRMRKLGFTFRYLPRPMATHYTEHPRTLNEIFRRRCAGYWRGQGQAIRYAWTDGIFRETLARSLRTLAMPAGLYGAAALLAAGIVAGSPGTAIAAAAIPVVMLAGMVIRRGPRKGCASFVFACVRAVDLVRGLGIPYRPPEAFPMEKVGAEWSGTRGQNS